MNLYEDEPVEFGPDFSPESLGRLRWLLVIGLALFGVACAMGGYCAGVML